MKLIERISPRWAYRRACYKAGLENLNPISDSSARNYDAGRADRLNAAWRVGNAPPGVTDNAYRDVIRARARDLERNSDLCEAAIRAFERNVVGWGLQLQPDTGDTKLDNQITALFRRWCRARNCDAQGAMTFDEMCKNIVRRKLVDGGILIVKSYGGSMIPLQIQLLEVDMLAGTVIKPSAAGNTIVNGVELNALGRTVGYWIQPRTPDERETQKPVFVPEKDAIFYKAQNRPGQVREMSPLAVAMPRMRDVEGFIEAQSMKERIAACFAAFIKRTTGSSVLGMGGKRNGNDALSKPYDGSTITPGMVAHLSPDEDIAFAQPPNAGSETTQFTRLLTRMMGAALGLSYEVISRDMSQVTYSSARQGLIEDEATYTMEQQSLIDHVLTEVYENFIISAVLAGQLPITDLWENKQKYFNHDWIPQGRKWIDPKKEADANEVALRSGLKPYAEVAGAAGYDWRKMMDQLKAEQDYAERIGLELPWRQQQNARSDAATDAESEDEDAKNE